GSVLVNNNHTRRSLHGWSLDRRTDGDTGGGKQRGPGLHRPSLFSLSHARLASWPLPLASYVNKEVRLIKLDKRLVVENHLDKRWEEATGETVDDVVFLSKHVASSNRPALTIHPIGTPHVREGEALVCRQKARMGCTTEPADRAMVTLEATHHGPEINSPTMFVEIGSAEEYWKRQDAAQAIALVACSSFPSFTVFELASIWNANLVWEGLGLGGRMAVGDWSRKDGVWAGHLLPGYSLLMEDPGEAKVPMNSVGVGGTRRETIKVAFETTELAFPGGEALAYLDQKLVTGVIEFFV
ncbi:hypothetical protein POUND7_005802, partial [Theobroma cacao]